MSSQDPGSKAEDRDDWKLKPISLWSTEDVCDWMMATGLPVNTHTIREKELSGLNLLTMMHEMGELTTNERLRQKILHQVQALREPRRSVGDAPQHVSDDSVGTDVPVEVVSDRLQNLTWLNDQQRNTVEHYLQHLEVEHTEAHKLIARVGTGAHSKARFQQIPIMRWTTSDVKDWLESVGMDKFSPMFEAHKITGVDLTSIDMQLLDSVGISSIQDRELILSRLYELQTSSVGTGQPTQVREMFQSHMPNMTSIIPPPLDMFSESGSEIPASDIIPPPLEHSKGDVSERTGDVQQEKELMVWHDFLGAPSSTTLAVTPQMSADDLLVRTLGDSEVAADPSRYYLTLVAMDVTNGRVKSHTLQGADRPYAFFEKWSDSTQHKIRFEIRSVYKTKVKVLYKLDEEMMCSKSLDISSLCTCGELLQKALDELGLDKTGDECYLLQALTNSGETRDVTNNKLLSVYGTKNFQLSELDPVPESNEVMQKVSSAPLKGACPTKHTRGVKHSTDNGVVVDLSTSFDFDVTMATDDIIPEPPDDFDTSSRDTGVHSTEPDLENNNNWLTDTANKPAPTVAALKEALSQKEMRINQLEKQTQLAQTQGTQSKEMMRVFHEQLEKDTKFRQNELEKQFPHLQKSLSFLRTGEAELLVTNEEEELLQQCLLVTVQQIQLTEQQESLLRARVKGTSDKEDSLKYQLLQLDKSLLSFKQQQADVYEQLKLARKQLLKQERNAFQSQQFSTYDLLRELGDNPSVLHQSIAVELTPHENFILGQDHKGRPIVKHCDEGSSGLGRGDRIVEVNGQTTAHMDEIQMTKLLQGGVPKPSQLVVLRKTPNFELKFTEKMEEVRSLREDLSMTMVELETTQEENAELQQQNDNMKLMQTKLKQEKLDVDSTYKELKEQFDTAMVFKNNQLQEMRQQVKVKEKENDELQETIIRAQNELQSLREDQNMHSPKSKRILRVLSRSSSMRSNQRDSGIRTLTEEDMVQPSMTWQQKSLTEDTSDGDIVIAYEDFDTVPLWESLQTATKGELLQALKDQILESNQQKLYLDRLLSAVIENAPGFVHVVDQSIGVEDHATLMIKARTEEFC